jgi:lysophospholipase L1-like esterase
MRVWILVSLFSLLFALAVGEIFLRLSWHNPYRNELPDLWVPVRVHHPHKDWVIDRSSLGMEPRKVTLRTDERGYILPHVVDEDPALTVAFLGGSTTACVAVQEDLRFPALTASLLTRRGIPTRALNAARPGGALHDSVNLLLNHVVVDDPDVVVLMHATNDIGFLSRPSGYAFRMSKPVRFGDLGRWGIQMVSGHSYLTAFGRQIATHRPPGSDTAGAVRKNDPSRPPIDRAPFEARLRAYVGLAEAFGIVPVLMTQPLSTSATALTPDWADAGNQDRFNASIRSVARETGTLLIDLVASLQEIDGWDDAGRYFYDGMHVTDDGSRLYAGLIAEALEATDLAAAKRAP